MPEQKPLCFARQPIQCKIRSFRSGTMLHESCQINNIKINNLNKETYKLMKRNIEIEMSYKNVRPNCGMLHFGGFFGIKGNFGEMLRTFFPG